MIIKNALMAFSIGPLPELPALLVGGPTPPLAAAGAVFLLDQSEEKHQGTGYPCRNHNVDQQQRASECTS
jgi:hypothetical protein